MAKTEIDSKAAEAANEEQVKETETQAEAEAVKEKEASSEDAQAPEGEKEKKGFFSSLVLSERKFGPVEGIPVLAAAIIAPPVVPVMDVQIFGVFHQDIPLFGTSLNPKS